MLDSLTHIPFFQDLDADQLALLVPLFEVYSCPAETVVFEQGDPALHLYLILDGTVSIRYKPYDAPPITLTHLGLGDAFGWSAVVGRTRYTSTLISDTDLETLRIRGSRLWDLCIKYPETGRIVLDRLARVVAARWTNSHAQVQQMLDQVLSKVNGQRK